MALTLHRAWRTDLLADGLAELLAVPVGDPFEREVVVVPARGVERWLTQRLSHRLGTGSLGGDGVCAGVRFLTPTSLIALLLGRDRDDPWAPDRLVWPLLEVIDRSLDDPWAGALARHLGHRAGEASGEWTEVRQGRRYSVARRLAGLFSAYSVQRPDLITAWRAGPEPDGTWGDGSGGALADDLAWQPDLWRRVVDAVQAAHPGEPAPDERLASTLDRLESGDPSLELPSRLSLFGHTRIPISEARLLSALGRRRDVHLWLPQASAAAWDALRDTTNPGVRRRSRDASAEQIGHPLLASLGRDARELQRVVGPLIDVDEAVTEAEPGQAATLLGWLQADLRANRRPNATTRAGRRIDPSDRSVQVHSCHGPNRQVEVLREVLVGLLEDDPTLEPRDIVVMCPDVETFAPLIQAGFGLGELVDDPEAAHPAHRLRVSLADRSLAATNPLLAVAIRLVELAGGRVTATEVLDLLATEPVRRRFGLDDDDLSRVTGWVRDSGVRWGLDAAGRSAYAMQQFGHNTWRAGLDRLLAGVAMSGDDFGHLGAALPLDDVPSSDIELVGTLTEFLDRLGRCLVALRDAVALDSWLDALAGGARALTDQAAADAWQLAQFEREFGQAALAARAGGPEGEHQTTPLALADVRAVLASMVLARPTRANFRTGTLSVCTLVPMRSVPHRVVCLVGLDDGLFPRAGAIDGDDVLARDPLTGERDRRSEDRQLLLDALMAAGETLVVCFTGADEHTGAPRPPAVPVDERLDAASRTAGDPATTRLQILTRHPLQPHDARNLVPAGLIASSDASFSFDRTAEAGARAAAGTRREPPAFVAQPLPPTERKGTGGSAAPDLDLADLKAFFLHPVRHFLRGRLDLSVPLAYDEVPTSIPIDLDSLETWGIGDRLLRGVLAGHDPQGLFLAEQLGGGLPPGQLGEGSLGTVTKEVQKLYTQTAPLRQGERRSVDAVIDLGGGRTLSGTVTEVFGSRIVSVTYSRLGAKQRLLSWLDLLMLSVAHPDESWTAHAVGKGRGSPSRALAGPLDHRAEGWLRDLVAVYDAGQRAPLPAPVKTAGAWAEGRVQEERGSDRPASEVADRAWTTDPNNASGIPGEADDAWHRQAFGESAPLSVLIAAGLPEVAWTIWGPLLGGPGGTGAEKVGPL